MAIFFLGLFFFSSCTKDEVLESPDIQSSEIDLYEFQNLTAFPSEITIDNWRQFVHAPQDLIDDLQSKEYSKMNLQKQVINENDLADSRNSSISGQVLSKFITGGIGGFFTTLVNLADVDISVGSCSTTSTSATGNVNYDLELLPGCFGDLCFADDWPVRDGLSVLDLVLISRHIIGLQNFTVDVQYIAADVNHDAAINNFDLVNLQQMILFIIDEFPNDRASIVYLTTFESFATQSEVNVTGKLDLADVYQQSNDLDPCRPILGSNRRVAIKTGDVNGSFNP